MEYHLCLIWTVMISSSTIHIEFWQRLRKWYWREDYVTVYHPKNRSIWCQMLVWTDFPWPHEVWGPLTTENRDRLICQLKQISYGYIYTYDFSKQKHILSKEEWEALTDLRKDDSIIVTTPDKGDGVIIVNKLDYLNKMKLLISNETKFKKLTQNPTKSREDSLISYLRKLKKDKIIDDATFHKTLICGSTPGVLYGLPKVHKPGCPFRPIVSSVNTYNYNLASYLVHILQLISKNQFTIKGSFSFADWAKAYNH